MNHILVSLIGCGNRRVSGAWLFILPAEENEGIQSKKVRFSLLLHPVDMETGPASCFICPQDETEPSTYKIK